MQKKSFISFVFVVVSLMATNAVAENRWAVIISGASGGEKYAEQMAGWRTDLRSALVDRYQFKPEFVKLLVDETATAGDKGSAANVRKLFAEIKKTSAKDDFVLIVLLGPRHLRRRRRQVQSRRSGHDREGLDRSAGRRAGPRHRWSTPPRRAFRFSSR